MKAVIQSGRLSGTVRAVTSKSCAHRALIASALADGETIVQIDADNRDILATADCLNALGAGIKRDGALFFVSPIREAAKNACLNCGESGSTLRFLIPVAAALGTDALFTGEGRLPERPHTPLCEALRQHGTLIDRDTLPMRVRGVPQSGEYRLPGNISSQYASGLLFALPRLAGDSSIVFTTAVESESYIGLTVDALAAFGIKTLKTPSGYMIYGNQAYVSPGQMPVEGDWSAAAFWLTANALGSEVRVDGLNEASAQGDRAIVRVLKALGAGEEQIDAGDIPDLVPILSVAAALRPGRTRIVNAARLRAKECDRLAAMTQGLSAMGACIRETEDGLAIEGRQLHGAHVSAWNDHRIAMSLAIAALSARGETVIDGAESVEKSYPAFWHDFEALGGNILVK